MDALYIVEPSALSIDRIIQDFTPPTIALKSGRKGPAYAAAHLFLTGAIPQQLFQRLAASPAAGSIKSFYEIYIDFVPFESRVFVTDRLTADNTSSCIALPFIFGTRRVPDSINQELMALERMADHIVSCCVTMGEAPNIRYSASSPLSLNLATLVQNSLDRYMSQGGGGGSTFKRGSTLIVLDRTFDLLTPLLHDFGYQAMANDLLDIPDGNRYTYRFNTAKGNSDRTVILNEADTLWTSIRHAHIADCSKLIIERFNQFVSENKAAMRSTKSSLPQGEVSSLADLRETMNALGEFQELKAQYSLHLSIAQDCLAVFEQKKLMEVAHVEQDLVTGETAEGEKPKDLWNRLGSLLGRSNLDSTDRARLVLLFLLSATGASTISNPADRASLISEHARLESPQLVEAAQAILAAAPGPLGQRASGKKTKRKSPLDEPPAYDVSRYIPALKMILDDAHHDELDTGDFPFVKNAASAGPSMDIRGAAPTSLRSKTTASAASGGSGSGSLFTFVIGGLSYPEIRSTYELSQQHKREFYLGSDRLLTPKAFLAQSSSRK